MVLEQTRLPVMEAFYTLQGEGFYQGRAAYFIRLGGCDVGCFWCDVKDSWDASKHPQLTVEEIVGEAVRGQMAEVGYRMSDAGCGMSDIGMADVGYRMSDVGGLRYRPIAVVTGGEPLMHNLDGLTEELHRAGFQTNIETSGAHPLSGNWDWICLSPKKFKAPLPEVIAHANELKVIIYNKADFKWAEAYAEKVAPTCKLYLQPEWDKSSVVMPLIIEYIKQNPKWELSLQIHKYINVP